MAKQPRSYCGVLPGEIVHAQNLTIAAKYLYIILSSMAYEKGFCWPENETLASEMQLSKRRVVELLGMLRDSGFIKIIFRQEGKTERRYIYCGMFPDRVNTVPEDDVDDVPEGCGISHVGGAEDSIPPCEKLHTPMREICFPIKDEKQIEKQSENPPKALQGAAGSGKPKRGRASKAAPDWKPERFEGFWRMYPLKKSKQAAIRAWDSLHPDDRLLAVMGHALQRQLASPEWQRKLREEGGQGIPYPATWLNGRRWEDEDKPSAASLPATDAGRLPAPSAPRSFHTEIINGEEVIVYDEST